jgi:hypothetical protein
MSRDHAIRAAFAVALLALVVWTQRRIEATPEKKEMAASNPFEKLPPSRYAAEYVSSMLLGGMRAIAIDYLWLQEMKAEKERRYVESNAILEMIAHLQPQFSEVWNHLSWVRAYNIAAQMDEPEDRWRWVNAGLESIESAIERNPGDEKLWFQKGYLCCHRVPQEQFLMKRYEEVYGADPLQVGANMFERAMRIAQAKGKDGTRPPSDGFLQEAYFRLAFRRIEFDKFDEAIAALRRGHSTYAELTAGRPITPTNEHNNEAFLKLVPVFELERGLAGAEAAGRDTAALRGRLLEEYLKIESWYIHIEGVEARIVGLLEEAHILDSFGMLRAGKAAEAVARVKLAAEAPFALVDTTQGSAARLWADMTGFLDDLARAMEADGKGEKNDAKARYQALIQGYQYRLPLASRTIDRIRRRLEVLEKPE